MVKRCRTAINSCLVLLMLTVIGIGACKKPTDEPPVTNPDGGALKYTIEGITDLTMERIGQGSMTLLVNKTEGKLENVMLSCIGLPKGATAKLSPVSIGLPSYNTVLTINCQRTPAGVYDVIIRGSSQSSGFKEFPFKLNVRPYANAAVGVIGYYEEKGNCSQTGAGIGDTVNVEKVAGFDNRVVIKGLWSGSWTNEIAVTLDPNSNNLEIPVQTLHGLSFSGTGTYDDNTMIIKYRVTGLTVNDNCTSTFSRIY